MIIGNDFYLTGFTRKDMGEQGAVFLRYDDPPIDMRVPQIEEYGLKYGGPNSANYIITIPKPLPRKIGACAIVTRSSRSRYAATCYDDKRITEFHTDTLNGLRKLVSEFFEDYKLNVLRAR